MIPRTKKTIPVKTLKTSTTKVQTFNDAINKHKEKHKVLREELKKDKLKLEKGKRKLVITDDQINDVINKAKNYKTVDEKNEAKKNIEDYLEAFNKEMRVQRDTHRHLEWDINIGLPRIKQNIKNTSETYKNDKNFKQSDIDELNKNIEDIEKEYREFQVIQNKRWDELTEKQNKLMKMKCELEDRIYKTSKDFKRERTKARNNPGDKPVIDPLVGENLKDTLAKNPKIGGICVALMQFIREYTENNKDMREKIIKDFPELQNPKNACKDPNASAETIINGINSLMENAPAVKEKDKNMGLRENIIKEVGQLKDTKEVKPTLIKKLEEANIDIAGDEKKKKSKIKDIILTIVIIVLGVLLLITGVYFLGVLAAYIIASKHYKTHEEIQSKAIYSWLYLFVY